MALPRLQTRGSSPSKLKMGPAIRSRSVAVGNPKRFAHGMDATTATKKFFLYKDIFGNAGGPPAGLDKQGSPLPAGSLTKPANKPGKGGGVGNLGVLAAARRFSASLSSPSSWKLILMP